MKRKCKNCQVYQVYEKRIKELEEELAYLRFELEQIRQKRYKPKKKRPKDKEVKKERKKRGGIFGHIGWFRKKPGKVDEVREIRLFKCPECGFGGLKRCKEVEEHIQEDIILPQVKTTLYKRYHYYCRRCKKVVTGKGEDELAHSYIGPKAKALAVFMKYAVKISEGDIKKIFEKVFNLKIFNSSITGFREQLKKESLPLYEQLVNTLKLGKFIHADETGWRIDGESAWVWKFSKGN